MKGYVIINGLMGLCVMCNKKINNCVFIKIYFGIYLNFILYNNRMFLLE